MSDWVDSVSTADKAVIAERICKTVSGVLTSGELVILAEILTEPGGLGLLIRSGGPDVGKLMLYLMPLVLSAGELADGKALGDAYPIIAACAVQRILSGPPPKGEEMSSLLKRMMGDSIEAASRADPASLGAIERAQDYATWGEAVKGFVTKALGMAGQAASGAGAMGAGGPYAPLLAIGGRIVSGVAGLGSSTPRATPQVLPPSIGHLALPPRGGTSTVTP